jgi:hypothetical protein
MPAAMSPVSTSARPSALRAAKSPGASSTALMAESLASANSPRTSSSKAICRGVIASSGRSCAARRSSVRPFSLPLRSRKTP